MAKSKTTQHITIRGGHAFTSPAPYSLPPTVAKAPDPKHTPPDSEPVLPIESETSEDVVTQEKE